MYRPGEEERAALRAAEPQVPEDVTFSQLDREVRGRLRTLSKDTAERAGRHLVMVARLIDDDPEAAYAHAQAAVRRAGRVDVVREAAGLAAYRTGRFAEALRELRTVRRLNGSSEHLPVMADAERGLGRPERAIALSQEPEAETLDADAQVELAIVVSGARLDLGQPEAAVAALSGAVVRSASGLVAARVAQARATALEAAGRPDEAAAELAAFSQEVLDEAAGIVPELDEVVVYDLVEESEDADAATADEPTHEATDADEATDGGGVPVTGAAAELADAAAATDSPAAEAAEESSGDGGGSVPVDGADEPVVDEQARDVADAGAADEDGRDGTTESAR